MKTLIIYDSQAGSTEKCARRIQENLEAEASLCPVDAVDGQTLEQFPFVIIGSPIYMGTITKKTANFCRKNTALLQTKRLGLFLCGLNVHDPEAIVNASFPEELTKIAAAKGFLGGAVNLSKLNPLKAMMVVAVTKKDPRFHGVNLKQGFDGHDEAAIQKFTAAFQASTEIG
jgi:menaquinone-dependent protoporphyrinogen oxidase